MELPDETQQNASYLDGHAATVPFSLFRDEAKVGYTGYAKREPAAGTWSMGNIYFKLTITTVR